MRHTLLLLLITPGLLLARAPSEEPLPVSIVQLIANPEKYDGKLVATAGFLMLGERPALYLHQEDADHALIENALWLDTTDKMRRHRDELHHKYVVITGTFRAGHAGHDYYKAGGITKIKSCSAWSPPAGFTDP